MNILLLMVVLLLLFGGGGFYFGGPVIGGSGLGLILLICLVLYLMGAFRPRITQAGATSAFISLRRDKRDHCCTSATVAGGLTPNSCFTSTAANGDYRENPNPDKWHRGNLGLKDSIPLGLLLHVERSVWRLP
jgi:hypothetical protein